MSKAQIKQLKKKIDKILSFKKLPIFPIYGGASGGESVRDVTQQEAEILSHKGIPVPIKISLTHEQEFLEVLRI